MREGRRRVNDDAEPAAEVSRTDLDAPGPYPRVHAKGLQDRDVKVLRAAADGVEMDRVCPGWKA